MRRLRILASGLVLVAAAQPASAQSNSTGLAGLLLRFFSPDNPVLLANRKDPFLVLGVDKAVLPSPAEAWWNP